MTALLGINCALGADPAALAATGATFVRAVYRDDHPMRGWLTSLKNHGIEALLVGDSSPNSLSDNEGQWVGRMTVARANLGDLVKLWQWSNEPDGGPPASWMMPWQRVNRVLEAAHSVFSRDQGFTLIAPGLVSGDTNWPANLRFDLFDVLDAHLYAQFIDNPAARANLNGIINRYLEYGKQVMVGEYDSRTPGLSAYFRDYPGIVRAAVFGWDDGMTESTEGIRLGLLQNPAAMASFVAATGGPLAAPPPTETPVPVAPPVPTPTFVLGFKAFRDAHPDLIGDALEPERGGIPGFSVQRSTKGRLMAQYLASPVTEQVVGWTITFWRDSDGARFLFSPATGDVVQIA